MKITDTLSEAVGRNGAGIATVFRERRRTWEEVAGRVSRAAGALIALGLRPGERVAVLAPNSDGPLEYYLAILWAGGVVVPLSPRLAEPDWGHILADAGAGILIVEPPFTGAARRLAAHGALEHVLLAGVHSTAAETAAFSGYEERLAAAGPVADAGAGGDGLAGIFYTSGTTGTPKGVMLSHRNLMVNADLCVAQSFDAASVFLHVSPLLALGAIVAALGITKVGGRHVFLPRFTPRAFLDTVASERATVTLLVPSLLRMVAQYSPGRDHDLSSLRQIRYGGSPIPPAVLAQAMARFPGCGFVQLYSMTETGPQIAALGPEDHVAAAGEGNRLVSAGRPVPHAELRILNPLGEALPGGAVGEIAVRGPNVMKGYWGRPELTAETLRDGWMHTGDLGFVDEAGYLYVVDRLKDMIVTRGENVYSIEVENVIQQHPGVAMCTVFATPDPKRGEAVHAVVVPRKGAAFTAREIMRHCRERLPPFKCPRRVEIRREPLPISGTGKVQKDLLREPFWKDLGRRVN